MPVDEISVAHPTEILRSGAHDRELGTTALLEDGDGHGVEIAGTAAGAASLPVALPHIVALAAGDGDDTIIVGALEVIGFSACRAANLIAHGLPP